MKPLSLEHQSTKIASKLMLFDLALGGHHGNYIQHVIDYAHQQNFMGEIDIVVSPQFFETHRDTAEIISNYKYPVINLVPISETASATLVSRNSGISRALRNFREWQIFYEYAKQLQTTHALIMYLDTCELPLAAGMKSPCSFTGIYFRPTFHYDMFENHRSSWKESLCKWREKFTLERILNHDQLHMLLCLDPFAVKALNCHQYSNKIAYLADPVKSYSPAGLDLVTLRTKLGIEKHRKIFLMFGALDNRKGIYQLLDSIQLLSSKLTQNLCLLILGKTNSLEQANMQPKIAELRQTHPIQLIECYDFVPENEVSKYFQMADVVLAPYQRHVGMSGILLLAAAAAKPVISSDYGLMGELVLRYKLGLAVDSTKPTEIAQAIAHCLSEKTSTIGNPAQMKKFAEQNSIERYASTIFQYLENLPSKL
jgi:glycosyltransferase involved in cell wall biosynthesis